MESVPPTTQSREEVSTDFFFFSESFYYFKFQIPGIFKEDEYVMYHLPKIYKINTTIQNKEKLEFLPYDVV